MISSLKAKYAHYRLKPKTIKRLHLENTWFTDFDNPKYAPFNSYDEEKEEWNKYIDLKKTCPENSIEIKKMENFLFERYFSFLVYTIHFGKDNDIYSLEERLSEGAIGMLQAIQKFDLSYNVSFVTFALWWIRQKIFYGFHHHSSVHMADLPHRVQVAISQLKYVTNSDNLTDVSDEYCRIRFRCPKKHILKALKMSYNRGSLDQCVSEDDHGTLVESVVDYTCNLEEDLLRKISLEEFIQIVEENIPSARSRDIIFSRLGIIDGNPSTFDELGERYGISHEGARQIQISSFKKLSRINRFRETIKLLM